jgi:uncharacterized protein
MEVIRKIEPLLAEYLTIFPVVGIIGPRQVGKTTLAKALAKNQSIHYLDLESAADRQKLSDPVLYLQNHQDKLIILDEIQQMPQLMAELRGIIDADRRVGRFIILGSASSTLIKKSADSLAGRIGYIELRLQVPYWVKSKIAPYKSLKCSNLQGVFLGYISIFPSPNFLHIKA